MEIVDEEKDEYLLGFDELKCVKQSVTLPIFDTVNALKLDDNSKKIVIKLHAYCIALFIINIFFKIYNLIETLCVVPVSR